jgi:hypothetical protein
MGKNSPLYPSSSDPTTDSSKGSRIFELSLTSIIATVNIAASIYVAPLLSILIPKVFVGAFIMVPLNLFLSSLVWRITGKKIFTVYFVVFGLLAMPTTLWGSTPGFFKPLMGAAIGVSLDLVAGWLRTEKERGKYVLALVFPIIWWTLTGLTWAMVGLPIVHLFQAMLMSVQALRPVAQMGFAATFLSISAMTTPFSVVAFHLAERLSVRVRHDLHIPHNYEG